MTFEPERAVRLLQEIEAEGFPPEIIDIESLLDFCGFQKIIVPGEDHYLWVHKPWELYQPFNVNNAYISRSRFDELLREIRRHLQNEGYL